MKNCIYILILPLLFACETPIDPALPDNGSGVVVYSFFRPGAPIRIDVFNTTPILDAQAIQRNKDLKVRVLENGEFVESVTANAQGTYISSVIPSGNSSYSFETTAKEITFSATSYIPEAVTLSTASLSEELKYTNAGEYGYPAGISFTDQAGSVNYYSLEVLVEDCSSGCSVETLDGELNELLVEDLRVKTNGNADIEIGGGVQRIDGARNICFSDHGFDGETVTFKFFIIPAVINFNKTQNVKFILKSVSREYYDYLRTSAFQQELEDEGTLTEPVQITTNIQNGLGTFAGYNYSIYTIRH